MSWINVVVFLESGFFIDIKILCECVCKYIEEGVVIEDYKVDWEIVLWLLNEVLVMELICVLCYWCYYFMVKGINVELIVVEFFVYVNEE